MQMSILQRTGLPYAWNSGAALYADLAAARIVGWSAHRLEELINVDKIIRPAYMPLAEYREYKNLNDR